MTDVIRVLELRSVRGTGGGPEKTILLGAALHRPDLQVTVCYIRDRRDGVFHLQERAAQLGVAYVEVDERHSFDVGIWRQLRALVRARQIDIVHAHEYKTDLLALLLARRERLIPLATAHGWTGQSARERYVYYPADKRLLPRFPRVIAVSSEIQHELVRHGARLDQITVLLNSIDADAFRRTPGRRESIRRDLGYAAHDVVIGAVGRLERQKRFDLLLEAFSSVVRSRPEARLAIVGDGSLRTDLERCAERLNVADRCRFLGHREDIAALHHAFDMFVQSSEYEGTPNAVLEAMAMETPTIATDVGGTRELAIPGVHATIVPSREVPALSAAMEEVMANPAAALGRARAARERVEVELSFQARTRRLEDIYRELVRARDAGRTAKPPARA